jgi:hypothetical protein
VVFDGEHGANPRIAGQQVFGNPAAPGWASAGAFRDPQRQFTAIWHYLLSLRAEAANE